MHPVSAAMAKTVRDNHFLFLSTHDEAFYAYQLWKKIKIKLLKTIFSKDTVCPVGFFAPAKTLNGTFLVYQS